MTSRTLIIVNYRSAALTRRAIASARSASSAPLEVIVVDNSVDELELERLSTAGADRVIRSATNGGYSGGINLGLRSASGEVVLVSNPDVTFMDDAVDQLADVVEYDVAVAGPLFSWDDGGEWLLPPADLVTATSRIADLVASRTPLLTRRRRNLRFRRRVEFWRLTRPTRVSTLSGAVLAFRRSLLDTVGPFDERFRLYFEETDYLRRVRQAGGTILYVPDARCRHAYNQSAAVEVEAKRWFAESQAEYFRKWYGHRFDRLLRRVGTGTQSDVEFRDVDSPLLTFDRAPREVLVEVSPLADFDVAVGHFPDHREVVLPPEVMSDYRDTDLFMRVVDRRTATTLDAVRWRK